MILAQQRVKWAFSFFCFLNEIYCPSSLQVCFPVLIVTEKQKHAYWAIGPRKRKHTLKIMLHFGGVWRKRKKRRLPCDLWGLPYLLWTCLQEPTLSPRHHGLNLRVHSHWPHSCRYQWMSRTAAKSCHDPLFPSLSLSLSLNTVLFLIVVWQ